MLEHAYELGFFAIFTVLAYFYILPRLKDYITRYIEQHDKLVASKNHDLTTVLQVLQSTRESHSKFMILYGNTDRRLTDFRNSNLEEIITRQNRDLEVLQRLEINRIEYHAKLIQKKAFLELFNSMTEQLKEELSKQPLSITEICKKIS